MGGSSYIYTDAQFLNLQKEKCTRTNLLLKCVESPRLST